MILITGGLGFIGSNIINSLNAKFVIIENKNYISKIKYINNPKKIIEIYDWEKLNFSSLNRFNFSSCIHMGAISNTLETDNIKIKENNINFSKKIFRYCKTKNIDFIYASSAAVYGNGRFGFSDLINLKIQKKLKPLNLYGKSKLLFDKFIIKNFKKNKLNKIVGLRFFNVYGINEFHKHGQSSPIFKFYNEIKANNYPVLYNDFVNNNIEIQRDFIFIDDAIKILKKILKVKKIKSIINIGTGIPQSFDTIAKIVSTEMKCDKIVLKDLPINIKKNYQYFTCGDIKLLKKYKLKIKFTKLDTGVKKYLKQLNKTN